ncbi:hypothetical protein J26TS2_07200 [Shouchella clausii]|nr:hypothetical protein J26TS2_07200 [Shouchella clausii]
MGHQAFSADYAAALLLCLYDSYVSIVIAKMSEISGFKQKISGICIRVLGYSVFL